MFSDYAIYIRDKSGLFRERIVDMKSVKIVEKLNDPGSWMIKSATREPCPFMSGEGIVVYKNGEYYYSGVLKKISETYDGYNHLFTWTAQGASDLEYLKRRICYVDPETGSTTDTDYYTDTDYFGAVIKKLIDKNLGPSAMAERREPIVAETPLVPFEETLTVNLRFQVLLTALVPMLNAMNCSVLPRWDADTHKLTFEICRSNDLSQLLLFSTELNSVLSVDYLANVPQGNFIMSGGEGEGTERAFAYAENDESVSDWGRIEYFHDVRSIEDDKLQTDADTTLETCAEENVGYAAKLNTDTAFLQYRKDWNLGDFIGIVVHGKTIVRRILQVETNLTYERETVTPTIGTIEQGTLAYIFDSLNRLRGDFDYLSWVNN